MLAQATIRDAALEARVGTGREGPRLPLRERSVSIAAKAARVTAICSHAQLPGSGLRD
jgi:hypothetical protein